MERGKRLFRVRRTVLQLLQDRGYALSEEEQATAEDEAEFTKKFGEDDHIQRENLGLTVSKINMNDNESDANAIMVFFIEEPKVGVKAIKEVATQMRSEGNNVNRSIIVIQDKITPFAKQSLSEMQPKIMIEVFREAELLVNITKHVLVPEHRVLSTEEKLTLLKRYKVKETQLPRIQFNDPIARYYGMARGQVVRIVRPSETAGRYVTYRFCV
jgi:DNA-directed RNA polymerase I, II, and III subunit RPABC1